MKQCAILSMDCLDDFEVYDQLIEAPLAEFGWQTHWISWRAKDVDWDRFDVVLIRTPWDYQDDADKFMSVLEQIEQSTARLVNSLDVVRWNIHKGYLKSLADKGVPIVPSAFRVDFDSTQVTAAFEQWQCEEVVVKPCISANADDTFRLTPVKLEQQLSELSSCFKSRDHLIQPFLKHVIEEGEYSLFYFFGQYSHAILKTPKQGDFRVQEEHGGSLKLIEPEVALSQVGEATMAAITDCVQSDEQLAYARLDFVRFNEGFVLMEAELIEPSLYFNMDEDSPVLFAELFHKYMSE